MAAVGIHHIALTVSNFDKAKVFYTKVMGLLGAQPVMELKGPPHKHDGRFAAFAGQGFMVTLWEATSPAHKHDRYQTGLHHVAFAAPSRQVVDEVHQGLKAMGATILDAPAEQPYVPGYYAVYFADEDGMKIELVHTPG